MIRSAAVIIENNKLALMKRVRENNIYYLFPGGKVEPGETVMQACEREIKEELGINIAVDFKLCEVMFNENTQHYFVCHILSGTFGTGDGAEYSRVYNSLREHMNRYGLN